MTSDTVYCPNCGKEVRTKDTGDFNIKWWCPHCRNYGYIEVCGKGTMKYWFE